MHRHCSIGPGRATVSPGPWRRFRRPRPRWRWPRCAERCRRSEPAPCSTRLNSILFALLNAGDGLARLVPALAGAALVALPAFWRERIGRIGALGAALLLAISPVAIMTSRTASGEVIVAGVLMGVAVVSRPVSANRPHGVALRGRGAAGPGTGERAHDLLCAVDAAGERRSDGLCRRHRHGARQVANHSRDAGTDRAVARRAGGGVRHQRHGVDVATRRPERSD